MSSSEFCFCRFLLWFLLQRLQRWGGGQVLYRLSLERERWSCLDNNADVWLGDSKRLAVYSALRRAAGINVGFFSCGGWGDKAPVVTHHQRRQNGKETDPKKEQQKNEWRSLLMNILIVRVISVMVIKWGPLLANARKKEAISIWVVYLLWLILDVQFVLTHVGWFLSLEILGGEYFNTTTSPGSVCVSFVLQMIIILFDVFRSSVFSPSCAATVIQQLLKVGFYRHFLLRQEPL